MSSSSPPSYTSEDQTLQHDVRDVQASSVQRRKSSKEKAREVSGDPDIKSETSSISRRRSRRHSSHSVDAPRLSQEIIERIARQSVRSSRHINADLLKQIAKQGGLPKDLDQEGLPKFKVITGSEATRVYEKTLRWASCSRACSSWLILPVQRGWPCFFLVPRLEQKKRRSTFRITPNRSRLPRNTSRKEGRRLLHDLEG